MSQRGRGNAYQGGGGGQGGQGRGGGAWGQGRGGGGGGDRGRGGGSQSRGRGEPHRQPDRKPGSSEYEEETEWRISGRSLPPAQVHPQARAAPWSKVAEEASAFPSLPHIPGEEASAFPSLSHVPGSSTLESDVSQSLPHHQVAPTTSKTAVSSIQVTRRESSSAGNFQTQMSSLVAITEEMTVTPKAAPAQAPAPAPAKIPAEQEQASFLTAKFPAKPVQRCDLGFPIALKANHYRIRLSKPVTVYQYDIDLKKIRDPEYEVSNKDYFKLMFKELVKILGPAYQNLLVYNFRKNLYSLRPFPSDEMKHDMDLEREPFILKVAKINQIEIDPRTLKADDQTSIQVLDLTFTHNFNFTCYNINRSFFQDRCFREAIGFNTQLWKGAYSTVRPSEIGLTWNLDSANAVFQLAENVLDLAFKFYDVNDWKTLKSEIERDQNQREPGIGYDFLAHFQGREIRTTTGFRKKIRGFGPDCSFKFEMKDKKVMNIYDYFKEHHKITIKYPQLPCISLGKDTFIPMELCTTELRNKKKLSEKETADIIKRTAVPATDRQRDIQDWVSKCGINQDPILKQYQIQVDPNMIDLNGRVLPAPDIDYKQQTVPSKMIGTKGSWDHRSSKFTTGMSLKSWVAINFSGRTRSATVLQFTKELCRIGAIHGMNLAPCADYFEMTSRYLNDREAQTVFEAARSKYKDLELILVVFPGTSTAYNVCKTLGDLKYGIITQGVDEKNVFKMNDQTISNILLKMNTKLGGRNFILSPKNQLFAKYLQMLYSGPMMVFGADVTHPSPGESKVSESLAAVVGSLDKECSFYAARLYAQSSPKGNAYEMIHDLDKMVKSLLNEFFRFNKEFPKRIVFYRDGVSEGQFPIVLRHEINKIRSACQEISPGYKPAITFVVVQKRHHTRLFATNERDRSGRANNVPPGTSVDTAIVTPNLFDFFLCSHMGIQGTSRPCRYFVLHDDNNFSMNQMQILSHYLCHIYSRCPRSVSYPAPAYYSHLAAFRGRDYNRPPASVRADVYGLRSYEIELHEKIRNKMFFT